MTNKLYIAGTTIWLIGLAKVADFHPLENMTDLAGNLLMF